MKSSSSQSVPVFWKHPLHLLAFGFGCGASPKAPGTVGTALAVAIYLLLPSMHWLVYLLFLAITFGLGIWICEVTSRDLQIQDHPGIVWDEFVGYWITMFLAPSGWIWVVAGFAMFRLLDIVKPWPVGWADRQVHGGLGIMLDDAIAGIMAALTLQAVNFLLP
ncbi:MAG: phosphatidylglycerophosphatase A [Pseudohongiellaceae bacterium]